MYGWRARIAMMIMHSNTTTEPEYAKLAPEGVSVHVSRVRSGGITARDIVAEDHEVTAAAALLADLNARVIGYSCNAHNVAVGIDAELKLAHKISSIAGVPAIMSTTATVEALVALKAKRIVMATPYPADLNERNDIFWKTCGFEILKTGGLNMGGKRESAEPYSSVPISKVGVPSWTLAYNMARSVFDERADAVVLVGGNLRTIEAAEIFERDFGIPFISSNLAMFWAALQVAGVRESIRGYGRLLQERPRLEWVRMVRP